MSMSLIDRLIEPTKEYISFRDFLCHLSGLNNQPVYEVVTYLLHHDLSDKDFYYIDADYKIIKADFNDKSIKYFLTGIQMSVIFCADDWIFHDGKSLEQLGDDVRGKITKFCFDNMHSFFKRSDLLSFEPLKDLLHFDGTGQNQPASKEATQQEIGKYQRLLITYSLFTPDQVVCLLIDENPACISHNDEYHACCDMVSTALDANELTPINEKYQIKAEQVKAWFAKCGFIFTGFNDKIDQSSQQLIDVQEKIAPLATNNDSPNTDDYVIEEFDGAVRLYDAQHPKVSTLHTNLGKYQKELITYDVFTPSQIICLILDYHPNFSGHDLKFLSYWQWIEAGVRSGDLVISNEKDDVEARNIDAQQVKVWLARNNYVYEGFNDNIPADPIAQVRQLTAQLTDAQETIKQITNDYEKALARIEAKEQSTGGFIMGSPAVEQGEPKTSEQIISDFREQITQLTAENKELKEQLDSQSDAPAHEVQLNGIAKYNANKAMVITTAKAIAKYIWSMDSTQAIRTGDMVQQVRHVMHNVEPELLPDDKAIREWLSEIAPDYAKKGGKPSKNAPNQISLTMQK